MTKEIDISSEQYRVYNYANGQTFRIDDPVRLYVLDDNGTSHRVVDAIGMTHRPERGWVGISWMPKAGEPAFVA